MDTVIVTTYYPDETKREEIRTEIRNVDASNRDYCKAEALIAGEWVPVFKDYSRGPYVKWHRTVDLN